MTKNKVLIPIDGSQFSLQILPYVTRFLKAEENELILLGVAEEPKMVEIEGPGSENLTVYVDQAEASIRVNFADEMLLGHFALHFEGGVYLWHPHWKANPIYFKAGPFFYTPEFGKKTISQFFIGTYVKTHFGTAQFIGADLGFVFR